MGGPPHQGFPKKVAEEEEMMIEISISKKFFEVIRFIKPEFVVIENVPILSHLVMVFFIEKFVNFS